MKSAHSTCVKLLILLAAVIMSFFQLMRPAQAGDFIVQNDLIKLSNAYYEIALNVANGGIAYVLDKSTNQAIAEGGKENALWIASLDSGSPISSAAYRDQFSYAWNAAQSALTMTYQGPLSVTVTIQIADDPWLKMLAAITNHSGAHVRLFNLPGELRLLESDIHDALLPMMPGALISPAFFTKRGTFVNQYPGVMFADYLAARSARGKIALYGQRGPSVQPVLFGFEHMTDSDPGYTKLAHNYKTWLADGQAWSTPWVVMRIGQDYPETIASYRADNHIDSYKSLADKLGSAAGAYFAAPMYKLDLVVLGKSFHDLQSAVVDKMNIPGLIEFVAFQKGGHDRSYPDFLPPDKKWGSTEDFAGLVKYLQGRGSLVVPYTNFSWWDIKGPTMLGLPPDISLDNLVVKDENGMPAFETYGPRSGFVVSLQNDFVKNKIAEQHTALRQTLGANGIFEDQWGIRNAPYDFNGVGDPALTYFESILEHYRTFAGDNLMTESGVDVLADQGVGFMGTNYLWDMQGYRSATAPYTTYYPMAGMLLRDKVLLYQHNLAAQTWTRSKDMLRWNLAQGYNLSDAFFDEALPGLNMDNPWLNLVGVFQKYALSNYADQRIASYDDLGGGILRTVFATYQVYSNWSQDSAYTLNGNTLPPGGVITQANDHSITAGVFTAYNGNALSSGDHYLVETRSPDGVKIFQPIGPDTAIHVQKDAAWATVKVTAHRYDGTPIAAVDAVISGNDVSFTYSGSLNGQVVGYYQLMAQDH